MIEHLSYSSISAYLSCSASWKFKYLDNIPTKGAPELAFGSAFHSTIEQAIKSGHQLDMVAAFQENWHKQLESSSEIIWDMDTPESYFNTGIKMLTNPDIQAGIQAIKSSKIETRVELHVPGVPLPVVGYIDVITDDGVPGDFKTSSKSWSSEKAIGELQPIFYLAALNQAGIQVPGGHFVHYIFVKTKTPQFQRIEHVHQPKEMFWLFGMIRKVWEAIDKECFPPNPTSWKCSYNWCDYWTICRGKP